MFVLILGPIAGGLCDFVEPVMGHSPLLWTAALLSYIVSVCLTLHTHTHLHTHMLLKETCDSDRVISHIIVNRLKIPQGLSTLLFLLVECSSLKGRSLQ